MFADPASFEEFLKRFARILDRLSSPRSERGEQTPRPLQLERQTAISAEYRIVPEEELKPPVFKEGDKVKYESRAGNWIRADVVGVLPDGKYEIKRPRHSQIFTRKGEELTPVFS